jgi:hypothetical protein
MPRKTEVIEPELAFRFGGVHVYHTYRNNEADEPVNEYHFMLGDPRESVDDTLDELHFDVRDLKLPLSGALLQYERCLSALDEAKFRIINTLLHKPMEELVKLDGFERLSDLISSHCHHCGCQLPRWNPEVSELVMPCLMCNHDKQIKQDLDLLKFHAADLEAEVSMPQLGTYPALWRALELDLCEEMVENVKEAGNLAFTGPGFVQRETVKETEDETASFTLGIKEVPRGRTPGQMFDRFVKRWTSIRLLQPTQEQ